MAKIDITKTELVWPGKYNEDGTPKEVPRVNLPFQVIETFNESRATRAARGTKTLTLFDTYAGDEGDTFESGWKNKLIWGDNLPIMQSLLANFAGRIDLIYIDPPFATGADFCFTTPVGESNQQLTKHQTLIEEKAYRDTWGFGMSSYLSMLLPRLHVMRDLLTAHGSIYVHLDRRVNSLVRLVLDDIFGRDNLRNEIVWCYPPKGRGPRIAYHQKHDSILYYTKHKDKAIFNRPYTELTDVQRAKFSFIDQHGRRYKEFKGRKTYLDESKGRPVPSWWTDIGQTGQSRIEFLGYPTQKPEALLRRIIETSSNRGGLIADFFCGSGTALAVAEKLGRRWIGCDLGRWGIHVSRKRLLDIEGCQPFELLNLGKYERQYWQGVTFGAKSGRLSERALYEYLAFILKLYGAEPITGTAHIHGKKGGAMVHIGAVDAPVTINEINTALDECTSLRQKELHILGWEWEMGLAGPNANVRKGSLMHDVARQKGVKLLLFQIPREVMEQHTADDGSVRFFELAYLKATIEQSHHLTVKATLQNFVVPNTDLIPDNVRTKIDKWSDYIDYWAVDWDFQNDTFMQGWVTYRTRRHRTLLLASDPHPYKHAGRYKILIKVIDIFGNDTSQAFDIEVG